MTKYKCAYIYPATNQLLPTHKALEKQFGAKVLYGLRKHRKITPLVEGMYTVEHAFHSVRKGFVASRTVPAYRTALVCFDESIDSMLFSLTVTQHVLTKFTVDDQIINQMNELNFSIDHLRSHVGSLKNEIGTLQFYQQKGVGDQQFFNCFPRRQDDIEVFSSEVQRMLDVYREKLKALFCNGW